MKDEYHRTSFADRIDVLLSKIEAAIDRLSEDFDVDVSRTANVLTLTFENRRRIVINSQEAAEEVWVAAPSGGFHFRWNDATARWNDTRSDEELRVALRRLIEIETGVAPTLQL